jgi:hypothetical protein
MLKRWRKLPQAGVGMLGLALALTLTLNADASSLREANPGLGSTTAMMFGGTPAEVEAAASSPAVVTPPPVQEFSSAGSGTISFNATQAQCNSVGLACLPTDSCQCVITTGTVTDGVGPLFQGPFTFWLNIDTIPVSHQYPNGNDSGKACFFASGVLSETPGPAESINFITSGAACNGISSASGLYSGGFLIGPSTGGYSSASGAGVLGFGSNISTKVGFFDLKGAASDIN